VILIPSSYHVQKGTERSACVALQDTTKGKQEKKALLKEEKNKMVQSVKDLDAAELSLQPVTDTFPHHILRAGAVKQAMLYSGFIQYQSLSLLFFWRY